MSLRKLTFVALLVAFAVSFPQPAVNAAERREPFELLDGDRVVLLGGTFFERAQRYGYLETALQLRFPDRKFSVRNLGWSGDTVFAESRGIFDAPEKGYARMIEQVKGLKPTVIFLHYGGNEAFNGEAYLDTFVKQYEKLLDDLAPTGAETVLVSPLPLSQRLGPMPDVSSTNRVRAKFGKEVARIAVRRSLRYLDISEDLGDDRLPAFESILLPEVFTHDGVTLTQSGYLYASLAFCGRLFDDLKLEATDEFKLLNGSSGVSGIRDNPNEPQRLRVTELSGEGRCRAVLSVKPGASQAGGLVIEFSDQIPKGEYQLHVNRALQWEFDYFPHEPLSVVPLVFLFDGLRKAVIEKNEMYFHRWRPQNVTYLFLFRKHEQGNNAKEVEEFEEIVAKLDDRIFELKQKATEVTIEIVRVGDVKADK